MGLAVAEHFVLDGMLTGLMLVLGFSVTILLLFQNRQEILQNCQCLLNNRINSVSHFEQTEALLGIYSAFSEKTPPPLPKTRGWAASPDFLKVVHKKIEKRRPNLVVELGSGSSTIISGYSLKKNGKGSAISFDHEKEYADITRERVSFHNLEGQCEVINAPLKNYNIRKEIWSWYSLNEFCPKNTVDIVIVDGPPGGTQYMARYPALELLYEYLSEDAIFIVDDADRKDEKNMVKRWKSENENIDVEYLESEKGIYIVNT
jgi:predicted O-methyltransferase YrrM